MSSDILTAPGEVRRDTVCVCSSKFKSSSWQMTMSWPAREPDRILGTRRSDDYMTPPSP